MRKLKGMSHLLVVCLALGTSCVPAWARYQPPPACKNPFTVEQEIGEGNKVAAQVYQQMPVLPDNDPVTRYVQQLGAHLVAHAPGYKWPFNFHVVASSDINAFALPGGSMFINLGTIQAAQTEAQLAGVMSHEMSHVILRHSTCNMAKQQNKSLLYGIGSIASEILLGNGTAGQIAQQGIGMGASLDFLHMSRDDEKQADLLGTDTLYDTGYDPRALPQFFETIAAKYGSGGAQLLSDHPNPGNRSEYVNAEIAMLPQRSNPLVTSAAFSRVNQESQQRKVYTAKEIEGGSWKQAGQYASGPGSAGQPAYGNTSPNTGYGNRGQTNGANNPNASNGSSVPNSSNAPGPLSTAQLGIGGKMTQYSGSTFTMRYPAKWQASGGKDGSVVFAPPGGAGSTGIVYGVVVDVAKLQGNGVTDADSLANATQQLAQKLSEQNDGLQQAGQVTSFNIGGQYANAVDLRGRSPLVTNGTNLAEHDWLIAVARPDGDLSYIIYVSPEQDFGRLKSTFQSMLGSFRVR